MVKYIAPEMEKIMVETEDIILASSHQHNFVNGRCSCGMTQGGGIGGGDDEL